MKNLMTAVTLGLIVLLLSSCQSTINKAAREVKYSAWEVVGVQKRDLFKKQVNETKEDQKETGEAFKDALDQLKQVYGFDGGNLEREYKKLNSRYEEADEKAKAVKMSIAKVETVAGDLFEEWNKEIAQISSADLRAKSASSLAETKRKYSDMHQSLKKSEAKMNPVLVKFRDQVLYLKHNLNAQAVASLKGESAKIENDIQSLIADMNKSIVEAEQFMKTLE